MAIVPYSYPVLPDSSEVGPGVPAHGATPATLASILNYYAGYRMRPAFTTIVEHTNAVQNYQHPPNSYGYNSTAADDIRIRCPLTPLARHLWIRIDYAALDEDTGGNRPSVGVDVLTLAGVLVDRGITFRYLDGTLPTAENESEIDRMTRRGVVLSVHSGTDARDAEAGAATVQVPRLLYVGAVAGMTVQTRVTWVGCRVVSVTLREYWEQSI